MAVAEEWYEVDRALQRLEQHSVLQPALVAMRKVVKLVRHSPEFADVHPVVSHASLVLSHGSAQRRVYVSWQEGQVYSLSVSFVDPPLEFSEEQLVCEGDLHRALRDYLDRLDDT